MTEMAVGPAALAGLDRGLLLRLYRTMLMQRLAETRVVQLFRQGLIVGGCYTGEGHEGVAVGAGCALEPDDVLQPLHRDLGARLAHGLDVRYYFANFLGRVGSPSRGKEGNLHIAGFGPRILQYVDHLGAGIPVAAGAALSFKLRREPRVALVEFGEGTTGVGEWHEGANLAATLDLPLVLVCWNNQFAYSTPIERTMRVSVAERGAAYGMPAERVDGNDVVAVYRAVKTAVERARAGGGPSLIEGLTHRVRGHSEADEAGYLSAATVEEWRARDPIARHAVRLTEAGVANQAELDAIRAEVQREVDAALAWAEATPYPDPSELESGVYCEPQPWP